MKHGIARTHRMSDVTGTYISLLLPSSFFSFLDVGIGGKSLENDYHSFLVCLSEK